MDYSYAILIDFGSTYTKMVLVDMKSGRHLKSDHFLSTVATDATIALDQCLASAREVIGADELKKALKLATSSAAGGLRMGVIGLSETLSLQAGRNAAFGAGAKILRTLSGRLEPEPLGELLSLPLEIILLTGGYEKGSTKAVLHNAEMLADSALSVPVIYAGNSQVAKEVRATLLARGKECYVAKNIIPDVGMLDRDETEAIIRDIFLKRIINMKGLSKVGAVLDRVVMPTPKAVLSAGELLARGTATRPGLGDLMIVDIGGATTDVHSYCEHVSHRGAKLAGTPEPYAKRTVEGDLGLNESKRSLIEAAREKGFIGREACETKSPGGRKTHAAESPGKCETGTAKSLGNCETATAKTIESSLPQLSPADEKELPRAAAAIAAGRHAGRLERTTAEYKFIQYGKDLSQVKTIVGTGGPIIYNDDPRHVLEGITASEDPLLPKNAEFMTDSRYLLFAAGLLREIDEEIAMQILLESIA